jgi:anti-sigma28 factor (negative regulator of flagellin synthesis)
MNQLSEGVIMKISEQGFTERISSQPSRANSVATSGYGSSLGLGRQSSSSDSLQLSNLAAILQQASSPDTSRAARIGQISQAVQSGAFRFDPSQISNAIVSEAVQGARN